MSGSVMHSQSAVMVPAVYSAGQSAPLPVAIDYPVNTMPYLYRPVAFGCISVQYPKLFVHWYLLRASNE